MKQLLCGLIVLVLFASRLEPGHADYTFTTLDVPGSPSTSAYGINNSGQVVGVYEEPLAPRFHAFLLSGGAYTSFDVPGSTGTAAYG